MIGKSLALALLLAPITTMVHAQESHQDLVTSIHVGGESLVSLDVTDVRVNTITEAIAAEVGLSVSGFDGNKYMPRVTISLKDRPFALAIEYVLGSCGLTFERTANTIEVRDHNPRDRGELLLSAKVAYAHAVRSFPDSDLAPRAHIGQGWIEEQNGDLSTAIAMYQLVPDKYPTFAEVADAYYHTARLNEELGNWRDAIQAYDSLESLRIAHEFHSAQRIGRARCDIELGKPRAAIYKIEVLDMERPTKDPNERSERLMVRARANNGERDYAAALRNLDTIAQLKSTLVGTPEYVRTTGVALEGLRMFGPAAQAWLAYAHLVDGQKRLGAIEMAVELFLDQDDEVSALYALRFGEDLGLTAKLTSLRAVVDERLGFGQDQGGGNEDPAVEIERAQAAWDSGDAVAAYREISILTNNHASLEESLRIKLYSVWARCTAAIEGLDAGVNLLRVLRPSLDALENRSALDLVAAEIYETAGLFDKAIDAYGGIYR
jgi:hypothetical protein